MTRSKILIGLGAVIGVSALLFAFGGEESTSDNDAQEIITPESTTMPYHGGPESDGIASRRVDPALPHGSWAAAGSDLDELQALANDAEEINGLLMADYEQWKIFDGWVEGYADDSDFGDAVAECSAKHGNGITDKCAWNHDVVVKRTGDMTGRVVYVNSRLDGADESLGCSVMVKCFQDAWVDRPAPMPLGDQEHISMETLVLGEHVAGAEGLGKSDRMALYEAALEEMAADLKMWEEKYQEEGAHFSVEHNYRQTKATHDHLVKLLEAMARYG